MSGLTGTEVPRKGQRVRVPCPPLGQVHLMQSAFFVGVGEFLLVAVLRHPGSMMPLSRKVAYQAESRSADENCRAQWSGRKPNRMCTSVKSVSLLRLCTIHALYMVACLAGFGPVFKFKYQAQTMSSNLMVRPSDRVVLVSGIVCVAIRLCLYNCSHQWKSPHDGRPILWKNRDTSFRHNELVLLEEGRYRALAVVNAGSRKSYGWV